MSFAVRKPLARLRQFTRTSIWRSTLAFTLIMLLVCGGLLATVYEMLVLEQTRTTDTKVLQGAQAFLDLAAQPGITETRFVRDVRRRARASSEKIIVLQTASGRAGNLRSMPAGVPAFPQTGRFPVAVSAFSGSGDIQFAIGTHITTPFGPMVVGVFEDDSALASQRYLLASFASLSGLAILLLLIGYLYNRRVLARLSDITRLLNDVEQGKLDTRLPISKRGDEYDTISTQINQMLTTIRMQVDTISGVTDSIAHDLRTPLGHIRINLEAIANESGDERAFQTLEAVDQLIQTFNAMLELSRLEKGALDIADAPCNLSTICEDAASLAEALLGEQQTLSLDIAPEITIDGNAHLLFRAVYNLLENAMRYSGREGQIRLTLKPASPPHRAILVVADNGPGIPPAMHEKVFERLFRLDESRNQEGFGMGLPLVRAVMQHHHGGITLACGDKVSESGPGLTVTLLF